MIRGATSIGEAVLDAMALVSNSVSSGMESIIFGIDKGLEVCSLNERVRRVFWGVLVMGSGYLALSASLEVIADLGALDLIGAGHAGIVAMASNHLTDQLFKKFQILIPPQEIDENRENLARERADAYLRKVRGLLIAFRQLYEGINLPGRYKLGVF